MLVSEGMTMSRSRSNESRVIVIPLIRGGGGGGFFGEICFQSSRDKACSFGTIKGLVESNHRIFKSGINSFKMITKNDMILRAYIISSHVEH